MKTVPLRSLVVPVLLLMVLVAGGVVGVILGSRAEQNSWLQRAKDTAIQTANDISVGLHWSRFLAPIRAPNFTSISRSWLRLAIHPWWPSGRTSSC